MHETGCRANIELGAYPFQSLGMKDAKFNYVRAYRQQHGLTARDLTSLLGLRSHSVIAKVESGDRSASLKSALALQVIFRKPLHRLFPGLYDLVEDETMRRVATMVSRLERRRDQKSAAKREYLESLAADLGDDAP